MYSVCTVYVQCRYYICDRTPTSPPTASRIPVVLLCFLSAKALLVVDCCGFCHQDSLIMLRLLWILSPGQSRYFLCCNCCGFCHQDSLSFILCCVCCGFCHQGSLIFVLCCGFCHQDSLIVLSTLWFLSSRQSFLTLVDCVTGWPLTCSNCCGFCLPDSFIYLWILSFGSLICSLFIVHSI